MALPPFHLAFAVIDLERSRAFYHGLLGCRVGRECDKWIDFDFFGHQITAHLAPQLCGETPTNAVDGKGVPVRHFGAILPWDDWHRLAEKLRAAGTKFLIEPYLRFAGEVGEQATMFLPDPSGNWLEFKSFKDESQIFARW